MAILRNVIREAKKSPCSMRHGAAILKGKKIYCTGHNSYRRSKYGKSMTGRFSTIHAEMDAIKNFMRIGSRDPKKFTIIVVRISRTPGELVNSAPCVNCREQMIAAGFKKISYSDASGEIVTLKLKNYKTSHVSKFYRNQ